MDIAKKMKEISETGNVDGCLWSAADCGLAAEKITLLRGVLREVLDACEFSDALSSDLHNRIALEVNADS